MNINDSASDADRGLSQPDYSQKTEHNPTQNELNHSETNRTLGKSDRFSEEAGSALVHSDRFTQGSQLEVTVEVALICRLISQLEIDQIQSILEFGQQELADRRRVTQAVAESRQTRLLLKKDYSYQNQGLSEPTQYYVYLRRRTPKLDRYIGTLFYVPQGCALSYSLNASGQVCFDATEAIFQLQDSQDPAVTRVVRLLGLEPPPPDYTFTKQQNDTPEIYLRLEHLDAQTYQPVAEELYSFPDCMYEGSIFDRYRWVVSRLPAQALLGAAHPKATRLESAARGQSPITHLATDVVSSSSTSDAAGSDLPQIDRVKPARRSSPQADKQPASRRIVELPPNPASIHYLTNHSDAAIVLERMRLWVSWSETSMPQSRWEIVQKGAVYTLGNANFKRTILSFSLEQASITLNNAPPTLAKWFHELGLAVSQSQRQYKPAQQKLAQQLFIDMSLPQPDPETLLERLFETQFSKTSQRS